MTNHFGFGILGNTDVIFEMLINKDEDQINRLEILIRFIVGELVVV